jgi:hypothetical protein
LINRKIELSSATKLLNPASLVRAHKQHAINPQFVPCLPAGPGGGADHFAGDAVALTALNSHISLFSHICRTRCGKNIDEHKEG